MEHRIVYINKRTIEMSGFLIKITFMLIGIQNKLDSPKSPQCFTKKYRAIFEFSKLGILTYLYM